MRPADPEALRRAPPFPRALKRLAPGVASIFGLARSDWPREIGIGISVAALGVPGGLALAQLAGLPPQTGLYACIIPTLVYALLGYSSRYLIVAPDTPTCMLIAVSLAGLARSRRRSGSRWSRRSPCWSGCFASPPRRRGSE